MNVPFLFGIVAAYAVPFLFVSGVSYVIELHQKWKNYRYLKWARHDPESAFYERPKQ